MLTTKTELSALDQIWQAEAEITGRIAAAREEAEQTIAEAKSKAMQIKIQARESGLRRGRNDYGNIISQAEVDAEGIISMANSQAEELQIKGQRHLLEAINRAVQIILGNEIDGEAA